MIGGMDPLMVGDLFAEALIDFLNYLRTYVLIVLLGLLEYIQCLPPLRPHPLRPRHSRLDSVCARE